MASFYDRWGLQPVINAAGPLTRLGGMRLDPEVTTAMAQAARHSVRMDHWHAAVGRLVATATGAEAALVTTGAAAGLTLGAAATIAGHDWARMDRLPDTTGFPAEIVVPRSHRNGYDHALRAAGARLVEVGVAERTRDPQLWELDAAITPQTVAVAYAAGFSELSLSSVVTVAHARQVPVVVDASATLPPRANLRAFIAAGADLVVFSGGKGLGGPQATGILCGRRDLVASAALQMWDLDYVAALWQPPALVASSALTHGVPNHGLGRAMKVGKEELAGLAVALERFLAADESAEVARYNLAADQLAAAWQSLPGARTSHRAVRGLWRQVWLTIEPAGAGITALELARQLLAGDPAVEPISAEAPAGRLGFDPFTLSSDEVPVVAERVCAVLRAV